MEPCVKWHIHSDFVASKATRSNVCFLMPDRIINAVHSHFCIFGAAIGTAVNNQRCNKLNSKIALVSFLCISMFAILNNEFSTVGRILPLMASTYLTSFLMCLFIFAVSLVIARTARIPHIL